MLYMDVPLYALIIHISFFFLSNLLCKILICINPVVNKIIGAEEPVVETNKYTEIVTLSMCPVLNILASFILLITLLIGISIMLLAPHKTYKFIENKLHETRASKAFYKVSRYHRALQKLKIDKKFKYHTNFDFVDNLSKALTK